MMGPATILKTQIMEEQELHFKEYYCQSMLVELLISRGKDKVE